MNLRKRSLPVTIEVLTDDDSSVSGNEEHSSILRDCDAEVYLTEDVTTSQGFDIRI